MNKCKKGDRVRVLYKYGSAAEGYIIPKGVWGTTVRRSARGQLYILFDEPVIRNRKKYFEVMGYELERAIEIDRATVRVSRKFVEENFDNIQWLGDDDVEVLMP